VLPKEESYMLIRDTIGSLTQIEGGQGSMYGTYTRKIPVGDLVHESDEGREGVTPLYPFHESREESLLCILHARGLNRNDSRSLERLGDGDDPNGHLIPGFEEIHAVELRVISPVGKQKLPRWKVLFKTVSPSLLIELRVSAETISGGSGSMTRHEIALIDRKVYLGENVREQDSADLLERLSKLRCEILVTEADFLLTLNVSLLRTSYPVL